MNSDGYRGSGPIPARWLHCPRKSTRLFVNKFIAFKTPLDSKFDNQVGMENRFPPNMLFDSMKSYKCEIGLWIDLTNTDRFYNKSEVEVRNCRYVKLSCRGHGETPSREQTDVFVKICKNFIQQNPLKAIGVHCTHGFNRTGFLLIAYAVEVMDWGLDFAIKEFAECRPPGIYKQDYLLELFQRYDDPSDVLCAPERPPWCYEEEEDIVDDDQGNDFPANDSNNAGRRRDRVLKKNPHFMDGVGGVTTLTTQPLLQNIQWKIQDFCQWRTTGFPGCQPVSMDQNNIRLLKKPYMVSWKADGTRYMMLILGKDKVYCADRDHCIFQVHGLTFPHYRDGRRHLIDTLLDGEMVIDTIVEKNRMTGENETKSIPRYLIYDIIACDGKEVASLPFKHRYECIDKEVIQPRHRATMEGTIKRHEEPFGVRRKDFFDIHLTRNLLSDKFKKQLSHEPDGLIFQPKYEPYVAGRCDEVLKWKPESHNSVDFKLKIVIESGEGCLRKKVGHLYVGGLDSPFSTIKVSKAVRELDNKIIECRVNSDNQWELMRERTDKSLPNSYNTAKAVMNSIMHPVTTDMLLNFIHTHCPKPQPPPAPHHQALKRPAEPHASSSSSSQYSGDFLVPPAKRAR